MSDVLTEKVVKTRKPHICFGCGRQFPEDTEMTYQTVADGGTVNTFYICGTCRAVMSHMDYWDEFGYGDLREEALELESERGVKPCESTK